MKLVKEQLEALSLMKNGCILWGDVGSGKSITSLSYYYLQNGGKMKDLEEGHFKKMKKPMDLYIITTARKRDTFEWEEEMSYLLLSTDESTKIYNHKVVIDSWNNIKKYSDVKNSFFIFDEQRVVGYGAWTKTFLKIVRSNKWILLSATPGDTWSDYLPVFIANGFYRNKTEFVDKHVVYARYVSYPKIDRYLSEATLNRYRNEILIPLEVVRHTVEHDKTIMVPYDSKKYREVGKTRWNPYTDKPIKNASELCYVWRKITNSHEQRQKVVLELLEDHPKSIIFYNFDYELDILRNLGYMPGTEVSEWNGHKHEPIPTGERWVYLVQYTAGAEGWNCITTDTIIFFSQTYSYKALKQSKGRINRMNTPFIDLYYYHLRSTSGIDMGIKDALSRKKTFNAAAFIKW